MPGTVPAALTARANQVIAHTRDDIHKMAESYRETLAEGEDPTVATGMLMEANLDALSPVQCARLLAVAITMLAETRHPEGVV